MNIHVIHEAKVENPERDRTSEMIAEAVRAFQENTENWPKLTDEGVNFNENEMICLVVADDFKKVVTVSDSNDHFVSFGLVCDCNGREEKGKAVLSRKILKNAQFRRVTLPNVEPSAIEQENV